MKSATLLERRVDIGSFEERDLRFRVLGLIRAQRPTDARERLVRYLELYGLDDAARALIRELRRATPEG